MTYNDIPSGTLPMSDQKLICKCGHGRDVHMRYELARSACYDCHCRDFVKSQS